MYGRKYWVLVPHAQTVFSTKPVRPRRVANHRGDPHRNVVRAEQHTVIILYIFLSRTEHYFSSLGRGHGHGATMSCTQALNFLKHDFQSLTEEIKGLNLASPYQCVQD